MILIIDSDTNHRESIKTALLQEYPNAQVNFVDDWATAYNQALSDTTVTAIVRSYADLTSNLTNIENIPDRVCVFYALGSNSFAQLPLPDKLYKNLVTTGAGDSEQRNNTGYGKGLCFWDKDLADTHAEDESSFSNGRICGKISKIKDTLSCSWWEAIWRARKTAYKVSTFWDKYNGFGKINVNEALGSVLIAPTSYQTLYLDYNGELTLNELKILLDITDNTQDLRLQILLDSAIDYIKSFCNITELPLGLKFITAEMVRNDLNNKQSEKLGNYSVTYNKSNFDRLLTIFRKLKYI